MAKPKSGKSKNKKSKSRKSKAKQSASPAPAESEVTSGTSSKSPKEEPASEKTTAGESVGTTAAEVKPEPPLKDRLHEIIFEADTPAGKAFDVALLIMIAASILVVMLESVGHINAQFKETFFVLEWFFTIFFTIEYMLRIYCVRRPWSYIFSFYGIIDLLAILPAYLGLFLAGAPSLMIIRALRLFRVFRIFKMGHFLKEGAIIGRALRASRAKITVFLTFVLLMVLIIGSTMYLVEGGVNKGFSSIPRSVYWAIVTLTTVGYGDISPQTAFGQLLASMVMITGYAVLAVPTGIVSAELIAEVNADKKDNTQACRYCSKEGHDNDAVYCKYCAAQLNES